MQACQDCLVKPNTLTFSQGRVILTFLVSAYGKSEHEHLYPKDTTKRALVDLYLAFDLSTMYQRTLEFFFPTIILGAPLDESKKARLAEALGFFETLLKNKKFCCGDDFTLADLSLCVTLSQVEAFDFDLHQFPKIRKWLTECKSWLEPYGYQVSSLTFGLQFELTRIILSGNKCHRCKNARGFVRSKAEAMKRVDSQKVFHSRPRETSISEIISTAHALLFINEKCKLTVR